uniref:Secreted protein n=1 Tax=Branchiostoma floridae TaxID=7739 RepID=C3ZML2_BRAFL|eukprot:XP_002590211.1 hypothetical protein BRAFLDRAFT_97427 [Branchiostoma floridae]
MTPSVLSLSIMAYIAVADDVDATHGAVRSSHRWNSPCDVCPPYGMAKLKPRPRGMAGMTSVNSSRDSKQQQVGTEGMMAGRDRTRLAVMLVNSTARQIDLFPTPAVSSSFSGSLKLIRK